MPSESEKQDAFKAEGCIDTTTQIGREVLSQPPATRYELWSYYLYYNGNNGYNIYQFLPTLLQYMAEKSGFNPDIEGRPPCTITNDAAGCNIRWLNTPDGIPVTSMIMYVTAISFALQFVLFTTFGSLADYGRYNYYILVISTLIYCAAQILPIIYIVSDGSGWTGMMVITIVANVSYGATLVFYAAAFPPLSDNLPVVRNIRADPTVPINEKLLVIEKWRNHVSAISTAFSNIGFVVIAAISAGISFIPWNHGYFINDVDKNTGNTFGNTFSYYCILSLVCGVYCLANAIPYFIIRPIARCGPPLPPNQSYLTAGWKSIFQALKEAKKYRYLFLYMLAYFMFSDGVNSISTLQTTLQNTLTHFNASQTAGMGLVTAVTSLLGCYFFLFIEKRFDCSTKTILLVIVVTTGVIPVWGCFGIGMTSFGIRNSWELWVLAFWSGFFTGPIWAWQQTLLAELVPRGKENLFFGLFGVVNKASTWIGSVVIGAVIEGSQNPHFGFVFIAILFVLAVILIWFVDVEAAKLELLHIEIHQELLRNEARNSINSPNKIVLVREEKEVPVIKLELYSDGSKPNEKTDLLHLVRENYPNTSLT